jgi:hypothetical protein
MEGGITEKIDMEKDLKYFFPKKDFWHSISKHLRSTNLITTYKLIEYEKDLLFSRHSEFSAVPDYKCPTGFDKADATTGSDTTNNSNTGTKEIWESDR